MGENNTMDNWGRKRAGLLVKNGNSYQTHYTFAGVGIGLCGA